MKSRIAHALLASVVVLGVAMIPARAEEAPKDNTGYTTLKTVVIDLGAEIPSM